MAIALIKSLIVHLTVFTFQTEPPPAVPAMASPASQVEVVYLANEGLLLNGGGKSVLIDGFVVQPYLIYDAVPDDVFERMLQAVAPFNNVVLALASHVHRDHFQPEAALRHLSRCPRTVFASSPDVLGALRRVEGFQADIEPRLIEILPAEGEALELEREGIRIEFLRIRHGGAKESFHNLGHIIHLEGSKILHIGDADMNGDFFEPYRQRLSQIDIALIPFWFFRYKEGRAVIEQYLKAKYTFAVHIAPAELEQEKGFLQERFPDVLVLEKALDTRVLAINPSGH